MRIIILLRVKNIGIKRIEKRNNSIIKIIKRINMLLCHKLMEANKI
jgi:hypothetical protein